MSAFYWPTIILACLYGGFTAVGGVMQLTRRTIPAWSATGMLLSGICLAIAATIPAMALSAIPALLLLHLFAVVNGVHLYGRIHLKHHIVRFILSTIIAILLVVK